MSLIKPEASGLRFPMRDDAITAAHELLAPLTGVVHWVVVPGLPDGWTVIVFASRNVDDAELARLLGDVAWRIVVP